ncbi:hypothetical protein BT93_H0916 [Corymbia citriodora subsp. variegata]|nr:hypothetical protein BT93_H0916 [Corymbia citriodora subsp. variegata]
MKGKREGEEMAMAAGTGSRRDGGSGRDYEVFLSFRGPDARLTIADCLYNDLIRAGICVFKDDEELRFGEEIEGGLLQAINESTIYILIFSRDYASSKWCLRELAHIVELSRDDDEKLILPIFYDVDVDDVKLKTELYRKALRKHESDSGEDLAKQWEGALRKVARITGRNLKDHGLDELKSLTVKEVASLLRKRQTDVPNHLVGIKGPIDDIMKKLDLEAFDVWYIVIHGMGGIGKTTLADVVFKQISPQFQDHCCFLKDVRTHDILSLQKQLLFNLRCIDLSDTEVANMIKARFHDKKVIIVLDDIDNKDQIMRLAGEPNWFGKGSRIIITTRNIEYLVREVEDNNVPTSKSDQLLFYEMLEMNSHDALQLFCERALGCAEPPYDHIDISSNLINVLGRLPLALDVVGSTLHGKCQNTWENFLCKLKKVMNKDVKKKLMISYEALEPNQQQIFLDIACFFINQEKTTAIKYWDAVFGYPTEIEVEILTCMSLVKIMDYNKLWMHDQLRDLGRDIVHLESCNIHLRGSRLWSPKDAFHVMQGKKKNENIVALNLGTPECGATYRFKREEFVGLVNLRFLQLDHGNFEGEFMNLFSELRWLSWTNCPLDFRATDLGLKNLVVLELSGNFITEEWGGWYQIMVANQLKVLKLVDCFSLRKTPNFSAISKLETLILLRCTQLSIIDESIDKLQHLVQLKIEHTAIESLPESIGNLKSLTELRIESERLLVLPRSIGNLGELKHLILKCQDLRKLPDSIGQLESLLELDVALLKLHVAGMRIRELPNSIGNLERLKILNFLGLELEKLPDSIGGLQSLVKLDLSRSRIKILPDCIGNLKKLKVLNLDYSHISELPKTIGMLKNLEGLNARNTHLEGEISSEIGALSSLKIVKLSYGRFSGLSTTINKLTNLQTLNLWHFPDPVLDFSNLTNLVLLCVGRLVREEPNIEGIERLRALRDLTLSVGKVALPPTDFSSLSQLQSLCVSYAHSRSLTKLPSSLRELTLQYVESPIDWSIFSNLENLSTLDIRGYSLGEIQFEVLGKLRKFYELSMYDCPLLKTMLVGSGLKEIRRLFLQGLPQLTEIQGLGELKSLEELTFWMCDSIKSLNEYDLSNLQNLEWLHFERCESLESVLGVPKSCELCVYGCPRFN